MNANNYAGPYKILSNTSLEILKKHGNLLISEDSYNSCLRRIARKKHNKKLPTFLKDGENDDSTQLLLDICDADYRAELSRLTGFCKFKIYKIDPCSNDSAPCLIIEREDMAYTKCTSQEASANVN